MLATRRVRNTSYELKTINTSKFRNKGLRKIGIKRTLVFSTIMRQLDSLGYIMWKEVLEKLILAEHNKIKRGGRKPI